MDLRDQLRGLTTAAQVAKCAAFRLPAAPLDELTATKQALRSLARRIKTLTAEAAELQTSIRGLVEAVAPHLLDQPGVGPVTAAQIYIAWSHPGRCRNEAAFARLAGVAPLEASSGQNTRHRLNRRGDRQLNRALHTIAVTRSRYCPHTQALHRQTNRRRQNPPKKPNAASNATSPARSTASSNTPKSTLDKHRSIVYAKARKSTSPGHTPAAAATKQPSPASPASPHSKRPRGRTPATAPTAAATANPTEHCTPSPSPAAATAPHTQAYIAKRTCDGSGIVSGFGWLIAQRRCGSMAL